MTIVPLRDLPPPTRFRVLEGHDYRRLDTAASLKGLLRPFKGKGALEDWACQCDALRDAIVVLAQRRVLPQTRVYPFALLPARLARQSTSAGTTLLRWSNPGRTAMRVALWQSLLDDPGTPPSLRADLLAMEHQRLQLNMQVSLLHAIARVAKTCARDMAYADAVHARRVPPLPRKETPP